LLIHTANFDDDTETSCLGVFQFCS